MPKASSTRVKVLEGSVIIEIFLQRGLTWDDSKRHSFESFVVKVVFAFVFCSK